MTIYECCREWGATHEQALRYESETLQAAGLLDPDQPTEWSHLVERLQAMGEFTLEERAMIRLQLGLRSASGDGDRP